MNYISKYRRINEISLEKLKDHERVGDNEIMVCSTHQNLW